MFLAAKNSFDEIKVKIIKNKKSNWKFWLKKYNLSFRLESKQNNAKTNDNEKVENKLNEFSSSGRSNLSQQAKCELNIIAIKI